MSENQALIEKVKQRARQLYSEENLSCSQAVLLSMNETFPMGIDTNTLNAMSIPFAAGIGGCGCVCGALGGSLMSLGILLGADPATNNRKNIQSISAKMHDTFKEAQSATCCRVIKKKHSEQGRSYCAQLVEDTAGKAAALLLETKAQTLCV